MFSETTHNEVLITLSFAKNTIERKVYSLTDWMNEVGGFHAYMSLLASFLLPFCQVWSLEKFLISKLYKSQSSQENTGRLLDDALAAVKTRSRLKLRSETTLRT